MSLSNVTQVIQFWFEESSPSNWFAKDTEFDDKIKVRFLDTYWAASQCELFNWRESAEGRLAEIIVLDQFSRNMFRDSAQAFAADNLAVALCQTAIDVGADQLLPVEKRKFLYMPLMHSESLVVHELAEKMFSQPGLEDNYEYEIKHKAIIEQFGRYPHRNAILGRESTRAEKAFLKLPGSSF